MIDSWCFSYDIYICHPYTGNRKFNFSKNSFFVILTWHEVCHYINQSIRQYNRYNWHIILIGMTYIYVIRTTGTKILTEFFILLKGLVDIVTYFMQCYNHQKWIFEKLKFSVPCVRMTYIYVIRKKPRVTYKHDFMTFCEIQNWFTKKLMILQ